MDRVAVTHFTDPGCPWAYGAEPAIHVLLWRYGDALDWRTALIGLTERPGEYEARGYTPLSMARSVLRQRWSGMPFGTPLRPRVLFTARACRAVVATRLVAPAAERAALRALHFAWFCTDLLLDEDAGITAALAAVPGLDVPAVVSRLDAPEALAAYARDRAEARQAARTPAAAQGKTARTDGPERFTAPTLVFERDGRRLVAGGHQSLAAYDVLLANLAADLDRRPPPDSVEPLLARFPHGLTTREVAALLARGNDPPDEGAAAAALLEAAAAGRAEPWPLAGSALWRPTGASAGEPER